MDMQAILALLPESWSQYGLIALSVYCAICTVCSHIDAEFPQPEAGSEWVAIRKVVAWLARNAKNAANAVPAGSLPGKLASTMNSIQTLGIDLADTVQVLEGSSGSTSKN